MSFTNLQIYLPYSQGKKSIPDSFDFFRQSLKCLEIDCQLIQSGQEHLLQPGYVTLLEVYTLCDKDGSAIDFAMDFVGGSQERIFRILENELDNLSADTAGLIFYFASEAWGDRLFKPWLEKVESKLDLSRFKFLTANAHSQNRYKNIEHLALFEHLMSAFVCRHPQLPELAFNRPNREFKFLCMNQRPREWRIAAVRTILNKNWDEQAIVSAPLENLGHQELGSAWRQSSQFMPFAAFEDENTPSLRSPKFSPQIGFAEEWDSFFSTNEIKDINSHPCLQTYFQLIPETQFFEEDEIFLTEKTFRAIAFCQPFVLLATPFSLAKLREQGYQTFSPVINEDYDEILDPVERYQAAMRSFSSLNKMSLNELSELYLELQPRLLHNFKHLLAKYEQGREELYKLFFEFNKH